MSVVVLGGTGEFGRRISQRLATELTRDVRVIVASRSKPAATLDPKLQWERVDAGEPSFASRLQELGARVVIHCAGPFQERAYDVAEACLDCRSHYIDLSDGREFVEGFSKALHDRAAAAGLVMVTGASTVPALSSAVLRAYAPSLIANVDTIHTRISPGNNAPRGLATVRSVLSYVGQRIPQLEAGSWDARARFGWMDMHGAVFPGLCTRRYVGACDIPDLTLFPKLFPSLNTVRFWAGVELNAMQAGLAFMAFASRFLRVPAAFWVALAPALTQISMLFKPIGTEDGVMSVRLCGRADDRGNAAAVEWSLHATRYGPHIPCVPAVVLAKKLLGEGDGAASPPVPVGAHPCVGLVTLSEYQESLRQFDVSFYENAPYGGSLLDWMAPGVLHDVRGKTERASIYDLISSSLGAGGGGLKGPGLRIQRDSATLTLPLPFCSRAVDLTVYMEGDGGVVWLKMLRGAISLAVQVKATADNSEGFRLQPKALSLVGMRRLPFHLAAQSRVPAIEIRACGKGKLKVSIVGVGVDSTVGLDSSAHGNSVRRLADESL